MDKEIIKNNVKNDDANMNLWGLTIKLTKKSSQSSTKKKTKKTKSTSIKKSKTIDVDSKTHIIKLSKKKASATSKKETKKVAKKTIKETKNKSISNQPIKVIKLHEIIEKTSKRAKTKTLALESKNRLEYLPITQKTNETNLLMDGFDIWYLVIVFDVAFVRVMKEVTFNCIGLIELNSVIRLTSLNTYKVNYLFVINKLNEIFNVDDFCLVHSSIPRKHHSKTIYSSYYYSASKRCVIRISDHWSKLTVERYEDSHWLENLDEEYKPMECGRIGKTRHSTYNLQFDSKGIITLWRNRKNNIRQNNNLAIGCYML